jgi:hypothetical protein
MRVVMRLSPDDSQALKELPDLHLQAVWHVLTDYNRLAEFIPNLAVSQRIALPRNAPSNIIRVRQVSLAACTQRSALPTSKHHNLQQHDMHLSHYLPCCRSGTSGCFTCACMRRLCWI